MKFDWSIVATMAVAVTIGIAGGMGMGLRGPALAIFIALIALLGVAAAAAIVYFKNRKASAAKPAAGGAAASEPAGNSEVDTLVREADHRLAQANAGATIANHPLIFVMGDRSTAKTSTVVNSGIEPELLAGQIYQDNMIAATRAANLWFARGTALVEAGGAILGDPGNWQRLVKRLQPGKLKSLKGGAQSPRAVLLCVSLESFTQAGAADAIAAAARYLQARLADIAQALGIRFPVYILFTKTDRVPFFTEFVNTFNNDEASQVFGVTVPIRPANETGVYAEDETRRLTGYFDNLFFSLCDKRTVFPPRDSDLEKICGAYEFPREMRKVRDVMVRFMVDVCRPSQLTTSPFLRGFYFTGVRPVVVTDAAPIIASRPQQSEYVQASSGATGMFRVGREAEIKAQQAVAQPVSSSRKVPQWMFLGHLFNNIILSDSAAMSASGSSVKVSALRRGLLIAVSTLCLIFSGIFLYSYLGNRSLEKEATKAAEAIDSQDVPPGKLPALASLQQLETLRQSLVKIDGYENDGAPYGMRWGLYQGSNMLPEVRRLYFAKFKALLFGQTQTGLLKVMRGVKSPPDPLAEYNYPYDTLKGYLLTTNEYKRTSEKGLPDFLSGLLLARWSENRDTEIGKDRMDLAKKQFDYYARVVGAGNPYSDKPDADGVKNARIYLSGFKGPKRVYASLLGESMKQGKPITFNQWAEGSSEVLLSAYPVKFAYTTPGAKFMQDQIAKANFGGEKWVLGEYYSEQSGDTATMQKGVTDLYAKDYISQWRSVLQTSKMVPYKDLKDAAKKLATLTSSTAPILAVFSWTSQNTANELPGVKDAFRAVQTVEPPTAPAYVPSVQPYNDSLQNLQAGVEKASLTNLDPEAVKPVQDLADLARKETRKISSTLPADPEAHIETVVGELMLKPITEVDRLIKPPDPRDMLNSAGAGFCSSFSKITNKFPFTRMTKDAERVRNAVTPQELADYFKPKDGKIWTFYENTVKKVLDCTVDCKPVDKPPAPVTPEFLRFFSQAVRWSHALYPDASGDPKLQYSLRPKKAEWPETFEVAINGDLWKTSGDEEKKFVWPGGANQSFSLTLKPGPPVPAESFDGQWAVFRFLADRDHIENDHDFVIPYHNPQGGSTARPLTYTFTVRTDVPVFSSDMKCVPTIAK